MQGSSLPSSVWLEQQGWDWVGGVGNQGPEVKQDSSTPGRSDDGPTSDFIPAVDKPGEF